MEHPTISSTVVSLPLVTRSGSAGTVTSTAWRMRAISSSSTPAKTPTGMDQSGGASACGGGTGDATAKAPGPYVLVTNCTSAADAVSIRCSNMP
eukprot:gene10258-biopygen7387